MTFRRFAKLICQFCNHFYGIYPDGDSCIFFLSTPVMVLSIISRENRPGLNEVWHENILLNHLN